MGKTLWHRELLTLDLKKNYGRQQISCVLIWMRRYVLPVSPICKRTSGNIRDISVFGQESNPTTWKLAKMNLAIRQLETNLGKHNADSFHDDRHKALKANYILVNPPFNVSDWGGERLREDIRWKYGVPPVGNANFARLQHMIHHLSPAGGVSGTVLANGSLSSNTSNEGIVRE